MQADETLGKFLDYCTYGHMIDNVVLIVTGTLHERDVQVMEANHRFVIGMQVGSPKRSSNKPATTVKSTLS